MNHLYQVQYLRRAYVSPPENGWGTWGYADSLRGLDRVYRAAYAWTHPQPNAWGGHVQVLKNGQLCDVAVELAPLHRERDYREAMRGYRA